MWKTIINILSLATLAIFGAILGGEYNRREILLYLSGILIYAVVVQHLLSQNNSLKSNLKTAEDDLTKAEKQVVEANLKTSQLLFQSNSYGDNRMYLALHPKGGGVLTKDTDREIQIIMNAPFSITPPPDIKITTKCTWGPILICGSQVFPRTFADDYEYTIPINTVTNLQNSSDKFFLAEIQVKFARQGIHEYTLEAKSKDFYSKISNSFEVA